MTIQICIHISDDAVVVLSDDDILAVKQFGSIEVWHASGETHMGNLPIDATPTEIQNAAAFWRNGFVGGVSFGRDEAQAKLRAAMGIKS